MCLHLSAPYFAFRCGVQSTFAARSISSELGPNLDLGFRVTFRAVMITNRFGRQRFRTGEEFWFLSELGDVMI
jgi:hypothetical protein